MEWSRDDQFCAGSITNFYTKTKKYRVEYYDDEDEDLDLFTQKWYCSARSRVAVAFEELVAAILLTSEDWLVVRIVTHKKSAEVLPPDYAPPATAPHLPPRLMPSYSRLCRNGR